MECDHKIINENGHRVCSECGVVKGILLDPRNMTYTQQSQITPCGKNYLRKDRFYRLFHNLRGLQEVPCEIMKQIPADISLEGLKRFLKKRKHLRKYINKLPSIWYQLGHKTRIITEQESIRACQLFCKIVEKKSFLVLLPYICKEIGRTDLLKFLKKPSKAMMKKYDIFI